jgi:oligopeptidase B
MREPATRKSETPAPPVARRIAKVDVIHGDRREDDYFWLREKSRPEVLEYLEAENAYTAAVMVPSQPLQESLYREMLSHIQETDVSAPYAERAHSYYARTEEGLQYAIHCRKERRPDAPEEVTLDVNRLAEGESYMSIGVYTVSDDGRLLAYSTDNTGFRQYTLVVKDLVTGELLRDRASKVVTAAWAADNQTLFYTVEDEAKRSYRLYRHRLGDVEDVLVYEESDERFDIGVSRTRSGAFLLLASSSHTTSEVRFLPADRPEGEWRLIAARRPDHEYSVDHRGERFFIRTNDRGRNFRLVSTPVADPGEAHWDEVVPYRPDTMIDDFLLFGRHAALFERAAALPQVRILDLDSGEEHRMEFPESAYGVYPAQNRVFETTLLRVWYESLATPPSVFDYDMPTRERTLIKQTPVPAYDARQYATERLFATAADGARVPVSLAYRKGLVRDGRAPLLLYVYGAYGYPLDAHFSPSRLPLLDRGFVFAIAHVRGGGDLGKPWHDQGRMLAKRNTFSDTVAAAEHLVAERYTSHDRLALQGGSAGGLTVAATVNLRPDLAGAAVLNVPFVDVVNTMLDETLPLTIGEFEEWGNPKKKDEYEAIKAYCPYTNLRAGRYPAMLVTTSLNDSQVMYWEAAKYVARLRALKRDERPLLLKTNMAAGHGGASGRYDRLREIAFEQAFLLGALA